MTEKTNTNQQATPTKLHDGWASRNVLIPSIAFVILVGISTVALFFSYADFDQWASLAKWVVAATFAAVGLGTNATKAIVAFAQAKQVQGQAEQQQHQQPQAPAQP